MKKDDCIFCKIANGEIPSATVYETPECRVILDLAPANQGHALILTKEHYDNIYQLDEETAGKVFSLATHVAKAVQEETEYRAEQWRSSRSDRASFPYACDSTSRRG